jgi:hypothetical protein
MISYDKKPSVDSFYQKLYIDVFFVDIQSFVGISEAKTITKQLHTIIGT